MHTDRAQVKPVQIFFFKKEIILKDFQHYEITTFILLYLFIKFMDRNKYQHKCKNFRKQKQRRIRG